MLAIQIYVHVFVRGCEFLQVFSKVGVVKSLECAALSNRDGTGLVLEVNVGKTVEQKKTGATGCQITSIYALSNNMLRAMSNRNISIK